LCAAKTEAMVNADMRAQSTPKFKRLT